MRRNRWIACIICILCMVMSLTCQLKAKQTQQDTIYDGVYIDGFDVGGLTKEEAIQEYEEYSSAFGGDILTLCASTGEYSFNWEDVDLQIDVEGAVEKAMQYGRSGNILTRYKEIVTLQDSHGEIVADKTINEEKLQSILEDASAQLNRASKNASVSRVDGEFVVYAGENGLFIEEEDTIAAVEKLLEQNWSELDSSMNFVAKVTEPDYTEEDFYSMDSVLGQAQTEYNSQNSDRAQNLIVGTQKVSGTTLLPGEQFSMYNTVAPFTEENGYKNAGQYVSNELVDGLGGGICQVSTTLYVAVLMAELQVDERYPHSMTVSYVPKSMDAAIATGYMDFCFTNNTGYPIYIEGYAGGGSISFAIYGHETRASNRTISYESKVIETYTPGEPEKTYDSSLPAGTQVTDQVAHTGYYVELWKNIYIDGELTDSVKVNASEYSAKAAQIRVGT